MLVAVSLTQLPSQAAAAEDSDSVVLNTVTVTAERRAESIQQVPISVTAISGETLDKFGATGFADYAHTIPNLSYGTGGDFGVTNARNVTIRVSPADVSGTARPPRASISTTRRCRCLWIRGCSI